MATGVAARTVEENLRTVTFSLPLAARAEYVQDAIHDLAGGDSGAARGLGWLLGK